MSARWLLVILGCVPALALLGCHALGVGGAVIRGGLGALLLLSLPGIWIAPLFQRLQGAAWDRTSFALLSFALSTCFTILNITLLKLLGVAVDIPAFVGLGLLEGGIALGFWWRAPPRFEPMTRGGPLALGILALMVGAWSLGHWSWLLRDLDAYFYHPVPMEGAYEGSEDWASLGLDVDLTWEGGGDIAPSGVFKGENSGEEDLNYRVFFLLQGQVGAGVSLECGEILKRGTIQRDVLEVEEEGAVPRYMERGIVGVTLTLDIPPGEGFDCALSLSEPLDGAKIVNLSGVPDWGFYEMEQTQGFVLSHYYQLLNIVENIRWAKEITQDRWLTIHQPPLWSYIYAAIVIYGGTGLIPLNVAFMVLIFSLGALVFRVCQLEHPDLPGYWALPIGLFALSHAFIIQGSGSTNFPDNLYALAIVGMFFGLLKRQVWLYVTLGVMASFLRYPGSTVVLLAAGAVFILDPSRRRAAARSGLTFLGLLMVPCALLGLGALLTGNLGHWLEILWFETFPEHFHGNYDLQALLKRPPEFYGLWMTYAGFTPLLLLGGIRGGIPRSAALLALVYSFFLCMIDHFPSHYFLPLLALTAVSVVGSVAHWGKVPRLIGLGALCLALGRWLLLGVP